MGVALGVSGSRGASRQPSAMKGLTAAVFIASSMPSTGFYALTTVAAQMQATLHTRATLPLHVHHPLTDLDVSCKCEV